MLEQGFIMLRRSLTRWEWYTDTNTKAVFLHLLLTANYEEKKWRGLTLKRGQRSATYNALSDELGLSVKCIRTALKHLKATGEVTSCATSAYSIFTVAHYDQFLNGINEKADKGQTKDKPQADEGQLYNKENNTNIDKKGYGQFQNVLLNDEEYESLKLKFPNYLDYIENLSSYLSSTGRKYANHYAAILNWAGKKRMSPSREWQKLRVYDADLYDFDEIERAMAKKAKEISEMGFVEWEKKYLT